MRLFRPSFFIRCLYPEALFRIKTSDKLVCLTFDDGPDPESTPRLLKILKSYKINALFFCSGAAAEQHAWLVSLIKSEGHLLGNHGYDHPNGWTTSADLYISDVNRASHYTSDMIFRPPYGHLSFNQYRKIKMDFRIVFWDLMPYDFDREFGSANSLKILKRKLRPGSIVVLHDTVNSTQPEFITSFIEYALDMGYRFVIPAFS